MNWMSKTGGTGAVIAAVCCFTPALTSILAIAGLASLVGYLDLVLLPMLAGCLLLFFIGLAKWKRNNPN